jgi:ribose/xylose/arabinose/galactoside ABC-type transport system permease subunit
VIEDTVAKSPTRAKTNWRAALEQYVRDLDRRRTAAVLAGAALVLIVAVDTPGALTLFNLNAIVVSASIVGVLAIGETVIMLSGNMFSLSLATTSAVSAMVFLALAGNGYVLAAFATFGTAIAINVVQGGAIGLWAANPIFITLAADGLQQGVVSHLTGNKYILPAAGVTGYTVLANGHLLHIPITIWIFVAFGLLLWLFVRRSDFGLQMYMLGDNRQAAKAAGLRVAAVTTSTFAVAGVAAGLAGIMLAAVNQSASLNLAGNNTLFAITAVLVGGTAVSGGKGSIIQTMIGAIVVSAMANLAVLRGYGTGGQIAVQGALILFVVVFLRFVRSKGSETV